MSRINNLIDSVVVLTLNDSKDRQLAISLEMERFGIAFNFHEGVKFGFGDNVVKSLNASKLGWFNEHQPAEFSCFVNHYTIIKKAYDSGVENLLIFEDDILLHNNFGVNFEEHFNNLPSDWEMFLLYSFHHNESMDNATALWYKAVNCWSSCGIGMNRDFMKKYIELADKSPCVADLVTFKLQAKTKSYLCKEFQVVPRRNVPSNIREAVNYEDSLRDIKYDNYGR